jgi:hypothetical protein
LSEEYTLKDEIGQIVPIVKAPDGTIIDGKHRVELGMTLEVVNPAIDTKFKVACAQLIANSNRRVMTTAEKSGLLSQIYEEFKIEHGDFPKAEEMAKMLGRTEKWLYQYLPEAYKREYQKLPPVTLDEPNVRPVNSPSPHDSPKRDTNSEVKLRTILQQAGFKVENHIACGIRHDELVCTRCGKQWTKDGGNCPVCGSEGINMQYEADLLIEGVLPIEAMGKGSSSDDEKRDLFFIDRYGTAPLKFTNQQIKSKLCTPLIIELVAAKRELAVWRNSK